MKKIWILVLATALLLTMLVGCRENNTTDPTQPSSTQPSISDTTPTQPTQPSGEGTTEPTNPTTPDATEPTIPDVTEPTEPTQPDVTEPTTPNEENPKPPEPEIVKPDIPENETSLLLSAMDYNEAYNALRYIKENADKYAGEWLFARGIYKVVDGQRYLVIPMLDQYWDANIRFEIVDGWFENPESDKDYLVEDCTILLSGEIALENGQVYLKNCDLWVYKFN